MSRDPFRYFQDIARDRPADGDDVCPFPAVLCPTIERPKVDLDRTLAKIHRLTDIGEFRAFRLSIGPSAPARRGEDDVALFGANA